MAPGRRRPYGLQHASPQEVLALTTGLQAASPTVPLLIAVDHEGGPVWRFRDPVTRLPAPAPPA